MTSLAGLGNIDNAGITNLIITNSSQLSACSLPGICSYLSTGKPHTISGNISACINKDSINQYCGLPCPSSNVYFSKQSQIDIFPTLYPSCTVLPSDLSITYSLNITNLDSLFQLTKVMGNVRISYNNSLIHLNGLSNLDTIGGSLTISKILSIN